MRVQSLMEAIPPFIWRILGAAAESQARKVGYQTVILGGKFYVMDRSTRKLVARASGAAIREGQP